MTIRIKREKRYRRHKRVRAKVYGTAERPRLCVFRSLKHIYAQIIDDKKGYTVISASDSEFKKSPRKVVSPPQGKKIKAKEENKRTGKVAIAFEVGKLIAQKALKKKIERVVFDRGGYKYHGRVKALAEGAREGGLKF